MPTALAEAGANCVHARGDHEPERTRATLFALTRRERTGERFDHLVRVGRAMTRRECTQGQAIDSRRGAGTRVISVRRG